MAPLMRLVIGALAGGAFAGPGVATPASPSQPIIYAVTTDASGQQLTFTGANFGTSPRVFSGFGELPVTSGNPTTIVVELPSAPTAGSYLLAVLNTGTLQVALFDATLGAVGPGVVRLVDSGGQIVGPFTIVGPATAVVTLRTPGRRMALPVSSGGFGGQFSGGGGAGVEYGYASNDCSGTPKMRFLGSDLGAVADGQFEGVTAGKLVYASGSGVSSGPMHSTKIWPPGSDPTTDPAPCVVGDTPPYDWGNAMSYDLSIFVPPFHAE